MLWFADRFGIDRMRRAKVILPTAEFFPNDYDGSEADARECFRLMCGYMKIDVESLEMVVASDEEMGIAAGLYQQGERSRIWIRESQLADPPSLLATIAHELAHELLLKSGFLSREEEDHEQVTDLLPAFLGIGIFGANATVHFESYREGNSYAYSISKHGYLSSIVLGYALAVFAYIRGERKPAWRIHLRTDARLSLKQGLNYLWKTGDCLFKPAMEQSSEPLAVLDLVSALDHKSATVRLSALWDLNERSLTDSELYPAVERLIDDKDDYVRCAAIRAMGSFGSAALPALPVIIQAAWYAAPDIRYAAIDALGALGMYSEECVTALSAILLDQNPVAARAAASALAGFGSNAKAAESKLLEAFGSAVAITDYEHADAMAEALCEIFPDAQSRVKSYMRGRSPEEIRVALGMIQGD